MPVIVGSLLLLPVFLGIAIYLAYSQGLVVTKWIAAMLFVFRPGKYGDQATVNVCNGWVRHRVRFQEDRSYAFVWMPVCPQGIWRCGCWTERCRRCCG